MAFAAQLRQLAKQLGNRVLACSNPECPTARRAWQRISNGVGAVALDGFKYCFPDCCEPALREKLERMQLRTAAGRTRVHRVPLGLLMLSRGDLNPAQLRKSIESQRNNGARRIGEWMLHLGYVSEQQVTAALATQWSCPMLKALPSQLADHDLPAELARQFRMAPVSFTPAQRTLHIAFGDAVNYAVLVAVEQMLECRTEPCLCTPSLLAAALANVEEQNTVAEKVFPGLRGAAEATLIVSSYAAKLCAVRVRTVACRDLAWARVLGERGRIDLLFSLARAAADVPIHSSQVRQFWLEPD